MKKENKVIARIFRFARKQLEMNQREFAKQLGVAQSTLSRIENGVDFPQEAILRKLELITQHSVKDMVRLSRDVVH